MANHKPIQKPIKCPKCGDQLIVSHQFHEVYIGALQLESMIRCNHCPVFVCESVLDFRKDLRDGCDRIFKDLDEKGFKTLEIWLKCEENDNDSHEKVSL